MFHMLCTNPTKEDGLATLLEMCPRCQKSMHEFLTRFKFKTPTELGGEVYTHWAICPNENEPILMTFEEETKQPQS